MVGHADKIRMQVRDVASDGKIYVDTGEHTHADILRSLILILYHHQNTSRFVSAANSDWVSGQLVLL